jgi:hypothetical protein
MIDTATTRADDPAFTIRVFEAAEGLQSGLRASLESHAGNEFPMRWAIIS